MPDTSGIYTITNTITGKQYIGRSVGINGRWAAHRALLDRFDVLEVIAAEGMNLSEWLRWIARQEAIRIEEREKRSVPSGTRPERRVA
jgi:hypothetical protein